jgi:hypothetical protein
MGAHSEGHVRRSTSMNQPVDALAPAFAAKFANPSFLRYSRIFLISYYSSKLPGAFAQLAEAPRDGWPMWHLGSARPILEIATSQLQPQGFSHGGYRHPSIARAVDFVQRG